MRMKAILLLGFLGCHAFIFSQSDCALPEWQLKPVIDRFNPFFTDHTWDQKGLTETVRLDPFRLLVVNQKSCDRHHIMFNLHIDPAAIQNNDKFWITEALVMMKRVYFSNTEYLLYKNEFEKEFIRNFLSSGVNHVFNFPINEWNFICTVEYGDWGAKVKIESTKYIIRENVRQPGIPRSEDAGWNQGD